VRNSDGGQDRQEGLQVYCICGRRGSSRRTNLGSVDEAAFYKLDKLVAIFDKNLVQATGPSLKDTTRIACEKWKAFGWHVMEIDGHNVRQIADALDEAGQIKVNR